MGRSKKIEFWWENIKYRLPLPYSDSDVSPRELKDFEEWMAAREQLWVIKNWPEYA